VPNPARPHPTGATPAPPPGLCARDRTEEAVTTHRHRHNPAPNGTARTDTPGRTRALHWVGRARPNPNHARAAWWRSGSSVARRLPAVMVLTVGLMLAVAAPAYAAGAPTINGVISNLTDWLVGILAGVATLFLTIGGLRYVTAGGDPVQVEKAKTALKSAAIGYALAALAPLIVSILASVVGGS
jgi:Type IV secretion system pilin